VRRKASREDQAQELAAALDHFCFFFKYKDIPKNVITKRLYVQNFRIIYT